MAEVFKAKAFGVEGFERLVAVKRILPNIAEDEEFITMFIDEAKIAVQLQHANIAQIFDLGKVDDSYFIALEYVHGRDLRGIFDHLRKIGERMPPAQVCYTLMQVCEGLDYAHNKRDAQGRDLFLVHRDVSPQNVLIGYEGEIKLVDFGIAKAAGKASKTQAGILKGKFGYMSPEQVRGLPVDRRSDVFAVGICLYELLTGERLFIGESDFSTLEKVRNVEILPPSSFNKKIAPELERIVLKALAKEVEDRYQSAIDLHDDLQAYLYSTGEFYSRKDLASWMKRLFGQELEEENAKNAEWEQLEQPTPGPMVESHRSSSGGRGLDWDEEELETQIFDRQPDQAPDQEDDSREAELSSSDILLPADGSEPFDDKTAIAPPPDEAELALDDEAMPEPATAAGPYGYGGGPPPGLSAYRGSSSFVGGPVGGNTSPWGQSPLGRGSEGQGAPGSPFRQTIMGLPQVNPPQYQPPAPPAAKAAAYAERRGPGQPQARRRRMPFRAVFSLAVLVAGVVVAYNFFYRPGTLRIEVVPADAVVEIDGEVLKGTSPYKVEKPPGPYNISFRKEGYSKHTQSVQIEAGGDDRIEWQLEASADTGFELTSDPPGQLVWLDGVPFTGTDPAGPQARTDFKATRVSPGRHVLEIKGDPRFKAWRHEFYQEPGRILVIPATLEPATPGAVAGGSRTIPPRGAEKPSPVVVAPPAPTPPPTAVATTPTPPPASPPASPPPATTARSTLPSTPPAATPPTSPAPAPTAAARTADPRPRPRPPVASAETGSAPTTEAPPAAPRPAAAANCSVTIGSKPWSEVWIDGRNTQKLTPLIDHRVPCGRRRITLKNPDLGVEKNEVVTVRPGERFKKIFQLLDDEG